MMSRRSSSTDRMSVEPLRVRCDRNSASGSSRNSRNSACGSRKSAVVGRSSSGNRTSLGGHPHVTGNRKSMSQLPRFGQTQVAKNRLSRGSGMGVRGGASVPKDPRPVSEKAYQHKCIKKVLQFLSEKGYAHNITFKLLQSPTMKEFVRVFEFILGLLNPGYKVGTKPEEEIPRTFKLLGYPFMISRSSMFAVGSLHTWPHILAALVFLVDLVTYAAYSSSPEFVDNLLFPRDEDFETMSESQIYYSYCQSTYSAFMEGHDTYEKQDEILATLLKQKYLGSGGGIDNLLQENAALESQLEQAEADSGRLKSLQTNYEVCVADEKRFAAYLSDLEAHKRQQDQQLAEVEEKCANLAIEMESENSKIVKMQGLYERQEFSAEDVERINIKRRELVRQREECERRCQAVDKDIWTEEVALSKEIEQVEGKCQAYNKLAQNLKLIPISAENSSGIDYEMKSSFSGYMGTEFVGTIKPALMMLKSQCGESASRKELEKIKHLEQLEQASEYVVDAQNEVSLLDSKYKRADDEVECKRQMYQTELQQMQAEVDEMQTHIMQLHSTPNYTEQAASKEIAELKQWSAMKESQREKRLAEYDNFLQAVLSDCMEHQDGVSQQLEAMLERSEQQLQAARAQADRDNRDRAK